MPLEVWGGDDVASGHSRSLFSKVNGWQGCKHGSLRWRAEANPHGKTANSAASILYVKVLDEREAGRLPFGDVVEDPLALD